MDDGELAEASPTPGSVVAETFKTSYSHIERWHEASETILIFDWDDTLLPTSYIWNHPRLRWSEVAPCFRRGMAAENACVGTQAGVSAACASPPPATAALAEEAAEDAKMLELLQQHASTVVALLRLAVTLGEVVIVTMAKDDWVDLSIRNFMPSLVSLLEELNIQVVYASSTSRPRYARLAEEDGQDLTQILKAKAMQRVVKKFYTRVGKDEGSGNRRKRSWKNVLSMGDSAGERLALQDVVFRHKQLDKFGVAKECRCKVIQMLRSPPLDRLTAELQVLVVWLQALVHHDGDIDLDFEELDEQEIPTPCSPPDLRPTRRKTKGSHKRSADSKLRGSEDFRAEPSGDAI